MSFFVRRAHAPIALAWVLLLSACGDPANQTSSVSTNASTDTSDDAQPSAPTAEHSTELQIKSEPDTSQTAPKAQSPSKEADAQLLAKVAELPSDAGKKRYDATCKACHAQGLLDSPKLSDRAAWQTRLDKGKGVLYEHSIKGFNKMPAQAVGDISDAEVAAAVDYMLEQAGAL